MLIRFEVSNFRSIREPVELSMVAVDRDREAARGVVMLSESLLTRAVIYGANASGKSNVLRAYEWLVRAVRTPLQDWHAGIPIDPFRGTKMPDAASEFTVEHTINGVRFEYILELTGNHILYEGLFHYPKKRRRLVFERDAGKLKLQKEIRGLNIACGLITDRVLALALLRRSKEPLISDFARELLGATFVSQVTDMLSTLDCFANHPEQARALLRFADSSISDVIVENAARASKDSSTQSPRVTFLRGVRASDFPEESNGTKTWFRLVGSILTALKQGHVFVLDAADAYLHPLLSAELLNIFADPWTNPRGAQLILASHDTSLLHHLNRDEVWLTEKDPTGSTSLWALAEYSGARVRKSQNLERGYLQGRFGARPDLDRVAFLRSMKQTD